MRFYRKKKTGLIKPVFWELIRTSELAVEHRNGSFLIWNRGEL